MEEEVKAIESGVSKETHIAIVKEIKKQYQQLTDSALFQAKLCKAVGDDKGMENFKKEAENALKKLELIEKELAE